MTTPELSQDLANRIEIEPSLGIGCIRCGAPATIALVVEVSPTIQQITGALCAACRELREAV